MKKQIKKTVFNISTIGFIRNILEVWSNSVVIFCFHRVLPKELIGCDDDPNRDLAVTVEFFDDFVRSIGEKYKLCDLDETLEHLSKRSTEKIAHITFDDGYKDNLVYALPILEKYSVPATIYIATQFVSGSANMWWYELWEEIKNKDSINFCINDTNYLFECSTIDNKLSAFKSLRGLFSGLNSYNQNDVLAEITESIKRKSYSNICFDWDEVMQLDKHPLITLGSHTLSHSSLSGLSDAAMLKEVRSSKSKLEQYLGHEVKDFSYPFGGRGQFGSREIKALKSCGYSSGVSTVCEKWRDQTLFEVPRFFITETSGLVNLDVRLGGLCNLFKRQLL